MVYERVCYRGVIQWPLMLPPSGLRAGNRHEDVHGCVGGVRVGQGAVEDDAAEGDNGAGLFPLIG